MDVERGVAADVPAPFPIHADLTERLRSTPPRRDAAVAHALAVCAGFSYADLKTMLLMAARVGLGRANGVRVSQVVDAMYVFSTAYLLQSACGRVVVLVYRGTELANVGNWLADVDVGDEALQVAGEPLRVHAGFHRNLRATRAGVLEQLALAAAGRSLADPDARVDHPLETLYVAGHSLGGAMAALFALTLAADAPFAGALRAVYTYGQPLVVGGPLPGPAAGVAERVFRHVRARDPIPALPLASWGALKHYGVEFRESADGWLPSQEATTQLSGWWGAWRAMSALFAGEKRRRALRYALTEHGPHKYIAGLRPAGRVTEFGD